MFYKNDLVSELVRDWYGYDDLEVKEEKDQFVIEKDMPGVPKDRIKVNIKDGVLSIEGDRDNGKMYVSRVKISRGLDLKKLEARSSDGVLRVSIPKKDNKYNREVPVL